ncbi:phage tail tape measure protein [uncultured Dysosmobacter sp.]|uniref:phage tail tape measure protein n=1 Tax=uncultured Dysosmobacter sp. TaxID=2591384 RepID=UPI0026072D5F|nr:phage tail tape measure protein [uncultured Dysosmobacter sp.]
MAVRTISTKLAIEGESEYRQSIANINNSLRTVKSELTLVNSQFRNNANSQAALTAKGKVLAEQLEIQKTKLDETKEALENARKAQAQYAETVADYGAKIAAAKDRLASLKSGAGDTAEEQAQLNAALEDYREKQAEAQKYLNAAQKGVEEWRRSVNYAQRDINNLNGKIEENNEYLQEAETSADHCATSIDRYGKRTNQAAQELKNANEVMNALAAALAAAGITRGLREIVGAVKGCVDASLEFESAMAGVSKTVDGTPEQLAAIRDGIRQMSTEIPATTTEIAAVAEAAGQLGIASEDVLAFSRVMLDLGESTNLSADEAATALARFSNIAGTSAADYDRLGSVIVGLGNHFATTEAEITEMATRLASSGTLAGLTEAEIMALAAAMSSVGIEAEAGGTAMTQTLAAIEKAVTSGGDDLEEFARISGMAAAEFSVAWKNNAITAIQAFISGLGKLGEQGESATLALDELGLSGIRQSNMLKSLALASDTLTGAVTLANQAWAENTALADEANKRYETTESKLAMCANAFDNTKAAIGDALAPALRDAAEAGIDAFAWSAEFIEENPWLVQALSGVTAGVALLTAGVTAYTAITRYGSIVTNAFSAALKNCPAIFAASAMVGLIAVVGTYAAAAGEASEENRELLDGLEESRKAFEETAEGIQKESDSVLASVTALESLAAVEVKSAAQKQAMADMVAQLNQTVPELSLAYDELNDSLSMTAEDIRAVAQAQAEQQLREAEIQRLTELYVEQAQIATDLAAAERQMEEAQAALAAAQEAGIYGAAGYEAETEGLLGAMLDAKKSVDELTAAQGENQMSLEAMEGKYDDAQAAIEDAGETAKTVAERIAELTEGLEDLSDGTKGLVSELDTLSGALQEQQEKGSLSLNTTLALIDAGYAAALSINEETGAVTLNKDAYIEIAKAKLDEQIASLQTQQTSVDTAIQLKQEAMAALTDAWAYAELKAAKDELEGLKGQSKAYEAQIAALQKLKDSLGSVTTAAKASASASKQAQTQAQKDLAAYQELKAALDHEKAMDLVSEREYYTKLKEYRDQYLTDEDNLSTYRQITEQIYSYDKSLVDEEAALWEEATENLVSELEDRIASIQKAQDKMAQTLAGYGDLFAIEEDRMSLGNLQDQIDAINAYEEALTGLKDRGISDSLMGEVLAMDVDEATEYARQLISMTEGQWDEYNALWEEKRQRAVEVAQKFYQDQLDALRTEYDDKLGEALSGLTDTAYTSGVDTAQGLIDGLAAKESTLYAKAKTIADEVSRILSEAYAASGNVDGSHAAGLAYVPYDGYLAELHQGERVLTAAEARNYIARSMPKTYDPPNDSSTQQVFGSMLAQAVNAVATLNSGQEGRFPEEIVLKLESDDGTAFGRWMVPFVHRENKSNPEVVSDKL